MPNDYSNNNGTSYIPPSVALKALSDFYTEFTNNNAALTSSSITVTPDLLSKLQKVKKNNIDALNTLLTSLMGSDASRAATISAITTTASTESSNATNKVGPATYNTRTPYVEVYINGALAVPTSLSNVSNDSTVLVSNLLPTIGIEVLFQDLQLSMPFGGVTSTINGTLKLFSRTPFEFLTFLTDGLAENSGGLTNELGLPVCDIVLGWNIADGTTAEGSSYQIRSPKLSFIVTNIQMTDPGKIIGTEFTLSLQDAGSSVLQNSSTVMGLQAAYPQDQLRVLIEKVLGLRLFTLDDLLQLGYNAQNIANGLVNNQTTNFQNETFFVNPQNAVVRLNYELLENAIGDLLNYISCRWYPISTSDIDASRGSASDAEQAIIKLKASFNDDSLPISADTKQKLDIEQIKLSTTCILVWVPFFPANIYTSSNTTYLNSENVKDIGAFLLLPKYIEDSNLESNNLPVIYGPGGSGIPYFYGGAQNVFQTLTNISGLNNNSGFSNTVGEVLDMTVNFNNYIALMKNKYEEEVVFRENGKFLSPGNVSKVYYNKTSNTSQNAVLQNELNKQLTGKYTDANGVMSAAAVLDAWKNTYAKKFKATQGRFLHSVAPRVLYAGDTSDTIATPKNRTYPNTSKMSDFSLSKVQNRIGSFLSYPLTIGMTVLGDPYLLRQGIGVFEVINYYPSLDGQTFTFNPIVSGVYIPKTIIHRISLGDYTTEIQALKVPNTVDKTVTKAFKFVMAESTIPDASTLSSQSTTDYSQLLQDLTVINLETLPSLPSNFKITDPTNATTIKSYANNQTAVLTNVILTGNLKDQFQAVFADFMALNKKASN